MNAPPPPAEDPRPEGWLRRTWRRSVGSAPRGVRVGALVLAIVVTGALPAAYVLGALGLDGSEPPKFRDSLIDVVEVCPSAPGAHPVEEWALAAEAWTTRGYVLRVVAGLCAEGPRPGEAQIRGWGDRVSGYRPTIDDAGAVLVSPDGWPLTSAVVYVEEAGACLREHEIGHVLGWDDALRAPLSRMHPSCGPSWDGLQRPEAP